MLVNRLGMHEMSMPDDDQHTLKFQRVRSTDVGQLVVTASNQFGSDLCTLQLAVAGRFSTTRFISTKGLTSCLLFNFLMLSFYI